jgi:predicted O-methyltransferase YrrM
MLDDWRASGIGWLKDALVRSPWRRRVLPRYVYNFDAAQLCFLCANLEQIRGVSGSIVEIGVGGGETTLFLNSFLDAEKIEKPYLALDTFAGFAPEDVEFEVRQRGKRLSQYAGVAGYHVNKQAWVDATMRLNRVTRVRSIRADVNTFDLTTLAPIAFCLLDVDLYRPVKKALDEVYKALSAGGVIVVDDCSERDARWDGALQAYREFVRAMGKPEQIVHRKLGLVTK